MVVFTACPWARPKLWPVCTPLSTGPVTVKNLSIFCIFKSNYRFFKNMFWLKDFFLFNNILFCIKVGYKVIISKWSLVLVIIWWSLSVSLTRVTNAQRGRLAAGYKYPGQCPGPGHHTWCWPAVHLVLTLQVPHWESYGQREDTNRWVGSLSDEPDSELVLQHGLFLTFYFRQMIIWLLMIYDKLSIHWMICIKSCTNFKVQIFSIWVFLLTMYWALKYWAPYS